MRNSRIGSGRSRRASTSTCPSRWSSQRSSISCGRGWETAPAAGGPRRVRPDPPSSHGRAAPSGPASVEWHGRTLPWPTLQIFEEPPRTGRPAFSGLVFGPVSNRPAVATNVPVIRDGRAAYVLGIAYSPDFYVDLLRGHVSGPEH